MTDYTHVKLVNKGKTQVITKLNWANVQKELSAKQKKDITFMHDCYENGSTSKGETEVAAKTSKEKELELKLRALRVGLSEDASETDIIEAELKKEKDGKKGKGKSTVSNGDPAN